MTIRTEAITIRPAKASELVDLRHAVLRAGCPRESATFEVDDDARTLHAGAFAHGRNIGCATMMREAWDGRPAYRLRGMAVDPAFHRRGIGRKLLELLEAQVLASGHTMLLWCNARTPAVPFYNSMGWQKVGEEFDIPTAGPHFKMWKMLEPPMNTDKHG